MKKKRVSLLPAPPKNAGKNTDAKENEYIEPANKFLKAVRSCKDVVSGGPSAAAGSDDERSSVVTEFEVPHWNTVEHQEEDVDYEEANSPISSEDGDEPTEGGGTTDAAMEEAMAYAESNGATAAMGMSDAALGNIIARHRSRGAHSDPPIPAPPTDANHATPDAEDAERAKQQRRDEAVLRSQKEQQHPKRIFMVSRDRGERVLLKKRDRSREMDRKKKDPSWMRDAPWRRRRGSKHESRSRSRGHKNRSRSRSRGPMRLKPRWGDEVESQVTIGVNISRKLVRRGPFSSKDPTLLKAMRPAPKGPLPALFGEGNFMISTWTMNKFADPKLVGAKLKTAPFGCIVIIMSSEVAARDEIAMWLSELAKQDAEIVVGKPVCDALQHEILQEKAVYRLSGNAFAAIHRAKVCNCSLVVWSARSRGEGDQQLRFCSMHLDLDDTRQAMKEMTLGIIDVKDVLSADDIESVVTWIVMDRVAILTGNFGKDQWMVQQIAMKANAIHDEALAQWITFPSRSRGQEFWTHPTYFVCFGFHRGVCMPMPQELPPGWQIGYDLFHEMIHRDDMPEWPENDMGSAYVPKLGLIKMKEIDFDRWCPFVIQTCLWAGTSTPSLKSQEAQMARSRGKSGQHKGHHKGQGNESGQGRGNTAVTGHWWQGQWWNSWDW